MIVNIIVWQTHFIAKQKFWKYSFLQFHQVAAKELVRYFVCWFKFYSIVIGFRLKGYYFLIAKNKISTKRPPKNICSIKLTTKCLINILKTDILDSLKYKKFFNI